MKTPEQIIEDLGMTVTGIMLAKVVDYAAKHYPDDESEQNHIAQQSHLDGLLAGYQAAKPQWISVKDRLPEEGQVALTICDNGKMFLLQKVSDEMFGVPIYWKYCCGFDKELGPNESYCYDVTHWMPLPKPPEEL